MLESRDLERLYTVLFIVIFALGLAAGCAIGWILL